MGKYIAKTRMFNVKLQALDPTGAIVKSEELSMEIIDDENSMVKNRLFIYIGECLYAIDKKGFIIDRIVPPLNSNELYKEQKLKL